MLALAERLERDGHLDRETHALATLRVVPVEANLDAGSDLAAFARERGMREASDA